MATEAGSTTAISVEGQGSQPRSSLRVFVVLFVTFALMIAVSAISLGYWTRRHLESVMREEITRNLIQKAQMLAHRVDADRSHGIGVIASQEGQAAGARATIIDTNGAVVADSESPVVSLQNEGRQAEFATALQGSPGVQTRSSNHIPVLYVAVPVSGGAVRLAYPLSDIDGAIEHFNQRLLLGSLIAVGAALLFSAVVARILPHR
jgi:two-component system phosphate regulon sensor histidine kinase PhoR